MMVDCEETSAMTVDALRKQRRLDFILSSIDYIPTVYGVTSTPSFKIDKDFPIAEYHGFGEYNGLYPIEDKFNMIEEIINEDELKIGTLINSVIGDETFDMIRQSSFEIAQMRENMKKERIVAEASARLTLISHFENRPQSRTLAEVLHEWMNETIILERNEMNSHSSYAVVSETALQKKDENVIGWIATKMHFCTRIAGREYSIGIRVYGERVTATVLPFVQGLSKKIEASFGKRVLIDIITNLIWNTVEGRNEMNESIKD